MLKRLANSSEKGLQDSDYRIQITGFRLQDSDLQDSGLQDSGLQDSDYRIQITGFRFSQKIVALYEV